MISLLLLKLLLTHFLGDFLLQPSRWVVDKERNKIRSKGLYCHLGVHCLLLILFLMGTPNYFLIIFIVLSLHALVDLLKLYFGNKLPSPWGFFIDQFMHLLVLFAVVAYFESWNWDVSWINNPSGMLFLLCLLLATAVSAIGIKVLIMPWKIEEDTAKRDSALKNAGTYIGILERLFVFGFVVMNYWSGIGFLLAAKSIFRFGDLTRSKDRKLTEYVLIGTLLSFGAAISSGLLYRLAKDYL